MSVNSQVRVYRTGSEDDWEYTGCVLKTGKSTFLGDEGGGGSHLWTSFFRLSGPLVAYVNQSCTGSDCRYDARTMDLRTRKSVRRVLNRYGYVVDLQIARSGSFAMLLDFGNPEQVVAKVEAKGGLQDLDYGAHMDDGSLAVGGSHIYWMQDGQVHSASIH